MTNVDPFGLDVNDNNFVVEDAEKATFLENPHACNRLPLPVSRYVIGQGSNKHLERLGIRTFVSPVWAALAGIQT